MSDMEVLAIGASIAGLLSLAAQCITGAQTLLKLCYCYSKQEKIIQGFLKDVNGLLKTLHDVDTLVKTIERASIDVDNIPLEPLRLHLDDCNNDIGSWIRKVNELYSSHGSGILKSWKAISKSVEEKVLHNVRDIRSRQVEISTALTIVGR